MNTQPRLQHLHDYFLFPFSIDRQTAVRNHPEPWSRSQHWIDGLDSWIAEHQSRGRSPVLDKIGPWRRAAYTQFDVHSEAYQDMVFFHPFVRRVFFDSQDATRTQGEKEALLRCYTIDIPEGRKLRFEASDVKDRSASLEVTDLRLFLFANGIGILAIGVEAFDVPAATALWINEFFRKVYPSSGRQVREGRIPNRLALVLEQNGSRETVCEEDFTGGRMNRYLPPLAHTITSLIYFADYRQEEFEPVLDERMIVYCYLTIDPASVPPGYIDSEEYQVLLSRFLYVDLDGSDYRYDREFTLDQMRQQMYRRWAHQGTWYGFTSYSNITATIGQFDCGEHRLEEGFLVHRMFTTRYYLMAMVSLFYRATLLDFAERTALVSKRLFLDQEDGKLTPENLRIASELRGEFLHFSNYWYFEELANKDEEIEHFTLQCRQYRIESTKREIEEEIEKLNASLQDYSSFRNTEAVNRLSMLSLIIGAGAVLTGFFGMNFGKDFARLFFEPDPQTQVIHYTTVIAVALLAFGALSFGLYLVLSNWSDYRDILIPLKWRSKKDRFGGSLKQD